jgi:hypothetical protein
VLGERKKRVLRILRIGTHLGERVGEEADGRYVRICVVVGNGGIDEHL